MKDITEDEIKDAIHVLVEAGVISKFFYSYPLQIKAIVRKVNQRRILSGVES